MSTLQETPLDALSWYKYGYVALTSLWVYDYILCIPDLVTYIAESRWGLGTLLYLASGHLPCVVLLLGMLTVFQPDASYTLCRFYGQANIYLGFLVLFFAECIFLLRTLAVYRNGRKWMVLLVIGGIAHIVPMIICCHKFASSVSGGCSIPGFIIYVDKKANSAAVATYSLLGIMEFEILLFLLYRAVNIHSSGWRIDSRLMSSILQQNLLYFGCNCAFFLALALTDIFLPYPVVHMVAESQVIAQALLVTRMHRDLSRSDRAFNGSLSLSTFMVTTPDVM